MHTNIENALEVVVPSFHQGKKHLLLWPKIVLQADSGSGGVGVSLAPSPSTALALQLCHT